MTKDEAITAMKEGEKVTHRYFMPNEWVLMGANDEGENIIHSEDGCLVEEDIFWEMREGADWDKDWSIWQE